MSTRQVFIFILQMIRPFPGAITLMAVVALSWALTLSLRPYLLKIILNGVAEPIPQDLFSYLALPVTLYLLMNFFAVTFFRLYDYFVTIKMIPTMRKNIANSNFIKLLDHSHYYYQSHFPGSLAGKINDLTTSVPELIQIVMDRFLSTALSLLVAIYVLWQVNIMFALATAIWSISLLIGALVLSKRLTRLSADWSERGSTATGRMVDVLSNILSVRLFARKAQEESFLSGTFDAAACAEQKLQRTYFWIWICYGYSFLSVTAFNLYFLLRGRQEGWVSVGDFALVLTINVAFVEALWMVMREFSQFSKLFGRIAQALETICVPAELPDTPYAKELVMADGGRGGAAIVFDQVQFHYQGSEPLFQNKSIVINRGEKVGLVGYSGSGKSTFVNLILRLFDVTSGRILIDGQDIREVTQDSLRSAIGMIPQSPSLFHRTLLENIRYGRPEATDEEVFSAAKSAHAHDFIERLPEGYESDVGERGVKLSGGQCQRIAIARAILKDAPLLILDEATSQLDSVTEQGIQAAMWELMQGKTTIVIAHRLSTLLQMDRILVFDQGKIVEDGPHQALLAQAGLYSVLWNAQVGGFLPDMGEDEIESNVEVL